MSYTFRPAQRDQAKPLIGLYSESGRGKTWSALLLARGFVGPNGKFGMIETESGRGEAYVGVSPVGDYLVCPIRESFSPAAYGKAISAAEQAGLGALIIDSASHEWEAVGGVLDMAAQNQEAGKKGPLVWQKPKMAHQKEFVLRLMTTPIPLVIVNMRAKYPMLQVTADVQAKMRAAGKKAPDVGEWVRSDTLEPKQSEDILFEMFVHAWLDEEHKLHVTKYPRAIPEFRDIIRNNEAIGIETGQRLSAWSKGFAAPQGTPSSLSPSPAGAASITQEQVDELERLFDECDKSAKSEFLKVAKKQHGIESLDRIAKDDFGDVKSWIARRKAKQQTEATTI